MANRGSFNTNSYSITYGNPFLKFEWHINSTDIAGNKDNIHYSVKGDGLDDGYYCALHRFELNINGVKIVDNEDVGIDVYNDTIVAEGNLDIPHEADGSKTFTASIVAGFYVFGQDNVVGDGSWNLPTIDRYATIEQTLRNKTINSISVNWNSDATIDYIWYSKDNGVNWTGIDVADGKSGYYTINDLNPNTVYNIKTKVRRKNTQLNTTSTKLSVTTYDFAKFINLSNSFFGDSINLLKSNESGLNNNLEAYIGNVKVITRNNISDSYQIVFSQSELDNIYKKFGNNNSIPIIYKLYTTCNGIQYIDEVSKSITLNGNAKTAKIKVNNEIKRCKVFIKKNGSIKRAVFFIKKNGVIKRCI